MLLQIRRHLRCKPLSLKVWEAFETERQEELSIEAEVRLAEGIVSPGLPKARPTFLSKNVSQISWESNVLNDSTSRNPRELS
jgi:hypothetical protein